MIWRSFKKIIKILSLFLHKIAFFFYKISNIHHFFIRKICLAKYFEFHLNLTKYKSKLPKKNFATDLHQTIQLYNTGTVYYISQRPNNYNFFKREGNKVRNYGMLYCILYIYKLLLVLKCFDGPGYSTDEYRDFRLDPHPQIMKTGPIHCLKNLTIFFLSLRIGRRIDSEVIIQKGNTLIVDGISASKKYKYFQRKKF